MKFGWGAGALWSEHYGRLQEDSRLHRPKNGVWVKLDVIWHSDLRGDLCTHWVNYCEVGDAVELN